MLAEDAARARAAMRDFRRRTGLTETELAKAIGIERWRIVEFEQHGHRSYDRTVEAFWKVLERYEEAEALELANLEGLA